MIDLQLALRLKRAGLTWRPALLDCFGLPDRQMDDKVFVISDMLATVEMLQGVQVVSFQGASEWALDSLVTTEAVWIPSEEQLRLALEAALIGAGRPELRLTAGLGGYTCELTYQGQALRFEAGTAPEAYAAALLHILEAGGEPTGPAGKEA